MSNGSVSVNNKGYIFVDLFDIILYGLLSVLFPVLTLWVEVIQKPIVGVESIYDLLLTELFFVASFFYDYYCRYRDCDGQTKYVVNVLCCGRTLFFVLIVIIVALMVLLSKNIISIIDMEKALRCIMVMGLYPFIFALAEGIKRVNNERKRKISR